MSVRLLIIVIYKLRISWHILFYSRPCHNLSPHSYTQKNMNCMRMFLVLRKFWFSFFHKIIRFLIWSVTIYKHLPIEHIRKTHLRNIRNDWYVPMFNSWLITFLNWFNHFLSGHIHYYIDYENLNTQKLYTSSSVTYIESIRYFFFEQKYIRY